VGLSLWSWCWASSRPCCCSGAPTTTCTPWSTITASCTRSKRFGAPRGRQPAGRDSETADASEPAGFPASAFRVSGSSTVRLTEADRPVVATGPAPPGGQSVEAGDVRRRQPGPGAGHLHDRERGPGHRVHQVTGPVAWRTRSAAVAAGALVVVLVTHPHRAALRLTKHPRQGSQRAPRPRPPTRRRSTSTTRRRRPRRTTAPPSVSVRRRATTAHAATYTVSASNFSLTLAATTGECWVDVSELQLGRGALHGTLGTGSVPRHLRHRTGHRDRRRAGAFGATVDGAAVTLPLGFQTPFTMSFVTDGSG
jgi:hypothetical protein